jgi:hypothetical protein
MQERINGDTKEGKAGRIEQIKEQSKNKINERSNEQRSNEITLN